LAKTLIPPRFSNLQFTQKVSHGLRIHDAHTNLPARGLASTNLPARSPTIDLPVRSPTHLIHQLRTSSFATSLKCEHGTYKPTRSYPHTRVTGYEPPRSYHHVFTTTHEPTRSWHNISWSKYRITTYKQHTQVTACNTIAWRYLSVARRKHCADRQARHPRRQVPDLSQTHCFRVHSLAEHTLPPSTTRCRSIHAAPIA